MKYVCEYCGTTFTTEKDCADHEVTAHKSEHDLIMDEVIPHLFLFDKNYNKLPSTARSFGKAKYLCVTEKNVLDTLLERLADEDDNPGNYYYYEKYEFLVFHSLDGPEGTIYQFDENTCEWVNFSFYARLMYSKLNVMRSDIVSAEYAWDK